MADGANMPERKTLGEAAKFWKWKLPEKKLRAPKDPAKRTVGDAALRFLQPWAWELKPKGKKVAKQVKWWSFWRWRIWNAKPLNLKRSPIPSLGNLMKVDPKSWEIMGFWADRLATIAVCVNLVMCALYAFIVATQSELPITRGWDAVIPLMDGWKFHVGAVARYTVITILALVALGSAVVLQLGTDFAVPFASGLAGEKYRVIPTLAFICLFPICATVTVAMKVDVYTGWGRERIAAAAETATSANSDQKILDKYSVAVPPTVAQSDAAIRKATRNLALLTPEYERQVKARDSEEANRDGAGNGMGPKWRSIDAEVRRLGNEIASAEAEMSTAEADKANRQEYDDADKRVRENVRTVTEVQRELLYDAPAVVWMRSGGMAFASVMFVLMSFMIRAAKAEAAKRAAAAVKGVETRRENANTFETDWSEAAPAGAPQIETGPLEKGPTNPATTRTPWTPSAEHPDKAGDDYGARVTGYDGDTDGTVQPDQPDDQR